MKFVFMTLTFLAAACAGGKLGAQPARPVPARETPAAPAAVKIGLVDLGVLFREQERVKTLKADLDRRVKPFEDKREELEKCISGWTTALRDPASKLTEAQRDEGQKMILECRRRQQDLNKKYHDEIGEHLGEEMVVLNREIRQTIKVFAEAHGYHLILAYNEPDPKLAPGADIQRQMTAIDSGNVAFVPPGGLNGLDVTRGVLDLLNSSFRAGNGLPRN